ncbi:MAG: ADP-ribose pyrophosphatase [Chthonomonadales bacterium]|nr:ADP-ribose pyrophosphatase [Chthonomonadales bacterium]
MDFPTVLWKQTRATFLEAGTPLPPDTPITASLVFALSEGRFVLADIAGRGWCIPGGRLEAGETPEQAAHREVHEEIGGTVGPLHLLGHYLLLETETDKAQLIPTYVATVETLGPLPPNTESQGIRTFSLEEVPGNYFTWDPLMEAVFAIAWKLSDSI